MKLLITEECIKPVPDRGDSRDRISAMMGSLRDQPPPQREFDESTIANVTMMGFSRGMARRALQTTFGNVEMAVENLLEGNIEAHESDNENEENKAQQPQAEASSPAQDVVMEEDDDEEPIKEKEDDKKEEVVMEKIEKERSESRIVVCTHEDLTKSIKDWLRLLFEWILNGYNSTLTDLDVENICQFMLKYVTKDSEVKELLEMLMKTLETTEKLVLFESKDQLDMDFQKDRKSVLKKVSVLTRILSNLLKYLVKNRDYIHQI